MPDERQLGRAQMAKELLANEVLADAMTNVRLNALVALSQADPDNKTEILRLQALANCLSEVRDQIEAEIYKSGEADGGVSLGPPP